MGEAHVGRELAGSDIASRDSTSSRACLVATTTFHHEAVYHACPTGDVAELADATDSKSVFERSVGSSPTVAI